MRLTLLYSRNGDARILKCKDNFLYNIYNKRHADQTWLVDHTKRLEQFPSVRVFLYPKSERRRLDAAGIRQNYVVAHFAAE